MRALGILLIVVAVIGVLYGILRVTGQFYHVPFAAMDDVKKACAAHSKPLGTPPGVECGARVVTSSGVLQACRKGRVNAAGTQCEALSDHVGPGILVASVVVLVVGIVVLNIKKPTRRVHETPKTRHHRKSR